MHWDAALRDLARTQEGLVARFHLAGLGFTADHWRRAKKCGRWDVLSPRVLRVRGAPGSDGQRALAAVFDASPGAILHERSALAWFGLGGHDLREIHVARPYAMSGSRPTLARLHQLRDLRPHHVIVVRDVPTEVPLRAIWAAAAHYAKPALFELGVAKVGRLLDEAHRKGLVTWGALHEMIDDIHQRGRSGTTVMRALADGRLPGSSVTESRNEDQLETLLANAAIPSLRRQVVVGGYEPIGRVDFCADDVPLAVEVNSLTFHTTPSDRAADQIRYRRLNDAGFTVVVVWEPDIWGRTQAVAEAINRGRRHAIAGERVVIHTPSCPWPPT